MMNIESSGSVNSCGNSVPPDSRVSAYRSTNTACPKGQISLPYPGVTQVRYHDVPVSVATVTCHSLEHNTSLHTDSSHLILYIRPM